MSEQIAKKHIKVLQCADIHLDTPYTGLSAEKSEERRRALRNSFMNMMQYVRDSKVDIVLICGDLFDTVYATNTTAEVLIREFRSAPDTRFIIAPGRSDRYSDNPIYSSGRLPENCYVFSESSLCRCDLDELNVTVYGWAFTGEDMLENPLYQKKADDISRINLVCGYADLDGPLNSTCCPVSSEDIKAFGADYYAFGSRHEASEVAMIGGHHCGYCGSLECTGFDEPGIGGATLITIEDGEPLRISHKRVSFGHITFHTEVVDITGVNNNNEIIKRISRLISDKKYNDETALRVDLVGSVSPRFVVSGNFDCDTFGLYSLGVTDKTVPLYGTETLRREMSIKGEFFRSLLPMLESEEEEERLVASCAFRVGLAALEKKDIDF